MHENSLGWTKRFGEQEPAFCFSHPLGQLTPLTPTLAIIRMEELEKLPIAYVLLNTEIGAEREVLTTVRKTEGVQEAFNLMGIYDIIARVKADTTEGLNKIISEKLQSSKVHSKITVVVPDKAT